MPPVNQCPFCGVREPSRAELEIHLASDHPGRIWNDRMPDHTRPVEDDPADDDRVGDDDGVGDDPADDT